MRTRILRTGAPYCTFHALPQNSKHAKSPTSGRVNSHIVGVESTQGGSADQVKDRDVCTRYCKTSENWPTPRSWKLTI